MIMIMLMSTLEPRMKLSYYQAPQATPLLCMKEKIVSSYHENKFCVLSIKAPVREGEVDRHCEAW